MNSCMTQLKECLQDNVECKSPMLENKKKKYPKPIA